MNEYLFYLLNSLAHKNQLLDHVFVFLASYLGFVFIIAMAFYIILSSRETREKRNQLALLIGALIVATMGWALISLFVKDIYYSPRPPLLLNDISVLLPDHKTVDSFPSGHTTFFFTLVFLLYEENKRWGRAALLIALVVALSRIAVGVHWPSDIFGGIIFAGIIALLTRPLVKKLRAYF